MSDNGNGHGTFRPVIREDGTAQAGGMSLFRVDDEGRVVFADRYRARCRARGTDDVPVDVLELLDALTEHLRARETF